MSRFATASLACLTLCSLTVAQEDLTTWQSEDWTVPPTPPAWSATPNLLAQSNDADTFTVSFGGPTVGDRITTADFSSLQLTGLTEDKLGIVIGAKPGMSTDTNAEFLLLMWGGATAPVSNSPQCTTGGASPVGLRLYYVSGVPTLDEFWQGTDEDAACSPLGQGLVQLAQANTLGTVGWVPNQTYNFDVRVSGCSLRVFVDGVLEFESLFDMSSVFDGQLGFACLSQRVLAGNVFSSPLPNPASLTEFGTGTMGTSSVPQLTSPSGCSVDGGQFTLRATNSSDTAAQAGVLYISPTPLDFFLPLVGGNIYVDPSFSVVIPIFAPAGGFVDQLVNLSPDPGLIGMDFAGQAGWLDPAGTANIALTNGLLTIIGA